MFVASSEFSLGNSLLSVEDIVETAKKNDLDRVIVADTMNLSSMIPLSEKLGDKLITGVRLTIVQGEAEQVKKQANFQLKVYPLTHKAIQIIYKFLSKSFERPYFYMEPRLDIATFISLCGEAGDELLVSTGDFNNIFNYPKYEWLYQRTADFYGTKWIADVCPVKTARWDRLNYMAMEFANKFDLACNYFVPCIYGQSESDLFPIHYSIHKNVEFNFLNPYTKEYYYHDITDDIADMFARINTRYGSISRPRHFDFDSLEFYRWKKQEPLLPQLSKDPLASLKKLTIEGFKSRLTTDLFGFKPSREQILTIYGERLKHEFKVLGDLGFSDYFLLVHELIDWCKDQNIKVGPGRGSVGGSLIAFCLGITDVDPVRFGLLFERFINPTRLDLPDIDLDFQTSRRGEIIEHLYDRYGKDNVAGIINYASLQASSALRSTCRILGLEADEYSCSKLVPKNFGFSLSLEESAEQVIEIKNFSKLYPDHWSKATKLEKKLRNFSTHAAGVIVSSRPLINDAVVEIRGKDETRIINWDKKICEKQGLIKLDILGLTTLDIMDLCVQYVNDRHGVNINLGNIPLDDKKTLEQFALGNTGGVFQFEGGSVKKLLKGLARGGDITFDDLVAANALNRPGPIEAGLVDAYVDGKNGNLHDAFHSSIADIVEPTFNVICYQEQIMAVSVAFAGYTLPEADNLRKIMGKKLPEEMKKEAEKFIEGAWTTNGIERSVSSTLFDQISKFAFYAFNKSHSVEYSLLSYICMWLKTNYPVEFYAASLTYIDDKKVRSIIMEANKSGIKVDPPSINHSTDKFAPVSRSRIVAPLSKIKYVQAAAKTIVEARELDGPFTSVENLQERTTKRLVNIRVVRALGSVGALDEIDPDFASMDPVERSKAINEYLPSLPLGHVLTARKIDLTHPSKESLAGMLLKVKSELDGFVMPFVGKSPKFMVVVDCPNASEAKIGKLTESKAFISSLKAMMKADLDKSDIYWTSLVKRPKGAKEKIFNNTVLDDSFKILQREIEIIKPPVILSLGSATNRMFIPSLKGSATDNAGQIHYSSDLDCNIILGFSPGMLYHNKELEEGLNELFEIVGNML